MRYVLTLWLIVSATAQDFKDSYAGRAKLKYERTMADAQAKYVRELSQAKTYATKRGDLEDAILIDKTLKQIEGKKIVGYDGKYVVTYSNRGVRTYTITGKTATYKDEPRWRIQIIAIKNGFIMNMPRQIERWTISRDGRYSVEHWNPERDFAANKPAHVTGKAMKVKK